MKARLFKKVVKRLLAAGVHVKLRTKHDFCIATSPTMMSGYGICHRYSGLIFIEKTELRRAISSPQSVWAAHGAVYGQRPSGKSLDWPLGYIVPVLMPVARAKKLRCPQFVRFG